MTKITNRFGLPQTLVNAMKRDDYSRGKADISVTGLLKPPRISLLYQKHAPEIEHDVSDNIWQLLGKAIHKILETGGDEEHITEERLFAKVRGWTISGALDLQKMKPPLVKITDYKSTSAWAVMNEKTEWVEQLNLYRWLLETSTNYKVTELAVCAFVRDWSKHEARRSNSYPASAATMVHVPMWTMERATEFVEERVRIHQEAQAAWDMGERPPYCTDEERWMRKPSYAVFRQGNKRPTRVFSDEKEAQAMCKEKGTEFNYEVREAEPIRCTNDYCSVSRWCEQFHEWEKLNGKA